MDAENPTAALLIIGAEVLSGKVRDENGPFLTDALRARGVALKEIRVIDDTVDGIAEAAAALASRYSYLFTTGGIGPTHDDVTIDGIAKAFDRPVALDQALAALLRERLGDRISEAHLRMARVPVGAVICYGQGRHMPFVQIENVSVLPGVPSLMRMCFASIAESITASPIVSVYVCYDVSETAIAEKLRAVQAAHPQVAIGSYPRFAADRWDVKITVDGRDGEAVQAALSAVKEIAVDFVLLDEG